jgi:hypothetical protein
VTTTPRHVVALIALVLLAGASAPVMAAKPAPAVASAPARTGKADATGRLESRHAQLLWRHRPDLAERYAAAPWSVRFAGLDEATLADHVRDLRQLLAAADSLPASERTDTLRVRLRRELADCAPDGALRRDALLWLDIVAAAARAPFASGPAGGCDRTRRSALQLRALPEALRSATVLMRGSIAPDPAAFEQRLGAVERLLRDDLPARTDACKESRRRAEFVEADSLAAASLADFRSWLVSGR